MYVYRVEDMLGRGPYVGVQYQSTWADGDHNNGVDHPSPVEEGIPDRDRGERICGFMSLNHLQRWFSATELRRLAALGYHLRRVKAVDLTATERQCVFRRAA